MPPGVGTGPGDVGSGDGGVGAGVGIGTGSAGVGDGPMGVGCGAGVGLDPPHKDVKSGQSSRLTPLWKHEQPIHSQGTAALPRVM